MPAKSNKANQANKGNRSQRSQEQPPEEAKPSHAGRETMESIVVAVILAFLFRSFVGEAFVIPTGSMAPTLQGRHLDVACSGCDYRFRVGASQNDPRLVACPNCGEPKDLDYGLFSNQKPFSGDRILVSKFSYDLYDPQRWDVIVFKFPGNAKQNYIKRLVGLPNELLKIQHGNVYATPLLFRLNQPLRANLERGVLDQPTRAAFEEHGITLSSRALVQKTDELQPFELRDPGRIAWTRVIEDGDQSYWIVDHEGSLNVYNRQFKILRKPPRKQLAMLQVVHDNRYINDMLHEEGWPYRWQGAGWSTKDGRAFSIDDATTAEVRWLKYRQLQPDPTQWDQLREGLSIQAPEPDAPGELITDYYAYNFDESPRGQHWMSDLAVETHIETSGGNGAVWLELVRAGHHFRCRFDLNTGEAKLDIDGGRRGFGDDGKSLHPVAASKVKGQGSFRLRMTNVDDEVRVWVNNRLLAFAGPTTYVPPTPDVPQWSPADPGDTQPVGVGSEGAAMRVKRLRVLRDIYYVAINSVLAAEYSTDYNIPRRSPFGGPASDLLIYEHPLAHGGSEETPQWSDRPGLFATRRKVSFALGGGQFFPMGDNSPYSEDARRWSSRGATDLPPHYVSEELMIGKALLIYWPHGWRPFFPNFARMGLIR